MPAFFITLEGPEGTGKSTQAELLAEALGKRGIKVKLTREPGGDPVSEEIRKMLLDGGDGSVSDRTELLLYLAARAQHADFIIRPHLEQGYVVICARYTDSTVAYQGYGGGIDLALIHRMNEYATNGLMPDLTILLDMDAEAGLKRQQDWNRMERRGIEYHRRVREGFLEEARLNPGRIVVVDASRDIQGIHEKILRHIESRFHD